MLDDRGGDERDHAAVDHEDLTGDPVGGRRGEVGDERCHVLRRVGIHVGAGGVFTEDLGGHRRAGTRADRVGANADLAQPPGGGERERGDAGLGRRVVGLSR